MRVEHDVARFKHELIFRFRGRGRLGSEPLCRGVHAAALAVGASKPGFSVKGLGSKRTLKKG